MCKAPRDLDLARRAVAQEALDVLVYPDLGMEPLTYFMAFARLAPVQVRSYTRSARGLCRQRGVHATEKSLV